MSGADPPRFQFTGSLSPASLYLERPSDERLLARLLAGAYCNVVGPRQIGKSSLRARITRELRERGIRCVQIDLTVFGRPLDADMWYLTFADQVARQLAHTPAKPFWDAHGGVTPAVRMHEFLREMLRREPDRRFVLLLDEIESVTLQDFPFDDFLPTLRSLFEARSTEPEFERLTIGLFGVTSPSDLIRDKNRTAYNISQEIALTDFTRAELDGLRPGFADSEFDIAALLDAIYGWTEGHPYMTMKICARLVDEPSRRGDEPAAVDRIVREEFLDRPLFDPNLSYASRRFDDPKYAQKGASLPDKLELYARVLTSTAVPVTSQSELQMELRLCGLVKVVEDAVGTWLRPRNRVFRTVFDQAWLRARSQRRYLSEAVWAWLDSGKDPSALLRGKLLEEAVAWARTTEPSKEEDEFLSGSLDQQRSALAKQEEEVQRRVVQIEAKLVRSEENLADRESLYRRQVVRSRLLLWSVGAVVAVGAVGGAVLVRVYIAEGARLEGSIAELSLREQRAKTDVATAEQVLQHQRDQQAAMTSTIMSQKKELDTAKSDLARAAEDLEAAKKSFNSLEPIRQQYLVCDRERRAINKQNKDLKNGTLKIEADRDDLERKLKECESLKKDFDDKEKKCRKELKEQALTHNAYVTQCESKESALDARRGQLENCETQLVELRKTTKECPADPSKCTQSVRDCLAGNVGAPAPTNPP